MATWAEYCSLEQVKQWLADSPAAMDPYEDILGELIHAASGLIAAYCGREFGPPALDEQRVFEVASDGLVHVVDLDATSAVAVFGQYDGTGPTDVPATVGVDYELGPRTAQYGWPPVRYDWLRPLPTSALDWSVGSLVRISGYYGYANRQGVTPYCVRRACVLLVARLWARRQNLVAGVLDPVTGNHESLRATDPDVDRLLRPFIHPRRLGPA